VTLTNFTPEAKKSSNALVKSYFVRQRGYQQARARTKTQIGQNWDAALHSLVFARQIIDEAREAGLGD